MSIDGLTDQHLGPRLVERLYAGAMQLQDRDRRLRVAFIIMSALLTLRAATIQHIREPWIDWELGAIVVPELDICNCRGCFVEAHRRWLRQGYNQLSEDGFWEDRSDIESFSDCAKNEHELIKTQTTLTTDDLLDEVYSQFCGKTDHTARTIPFGHSRRATAVIARFFDEFGHLDLSQDWIRTDLREAAKNAPGIDPEYVIPHGLRADGITILAELFPHPPFVKDVAGHNDLRKAYEYIHELARLRVYQAYDAAGRVEDAPPIVPENPGAAFPVLLDPTPFEGDPWDPRVDGSEKAQQERANDQANERFAVVHPRDRNLPDRAGFPEDVHEKYSIADHIDQLPMSVNPEEIEQIELPQRSDSTISQWHSPHDLNADDVPEDGFRVNRQTKIANPMWRFKQRAQDSSQSE